MIMSSSPVTSGSENDSQIGPDENHSQPVPERVLVITRWLGAHHGPLEKIVLPREPATEEERLWVETELLTRLVPDGKIEVAVENGSQIDCRKCRDCGCTDDRACPGGCWWTDLDLVGFRGGPLCSSCEDRSAS